jgi:hypothetical protein
MSEQMIVLLVVILGLFAMPFLGGWFAHRLKLAEAREAERANMTRELEDRVRMLERIVTDKGFDVASQIEALRDQGGNAERQGRQPEQSLS